MPGRTHMVNGKAGRPLFSYIPAFRKKSDEIVAETVCIQLVSSFATGYWITYCIAITTITSAVYDTVKRTFTWIDEKCHAPK